MRKILLVMMTAFGLLSGAALAEPFEAGKNYVILDNPVPVAVPGKIEVVSMFWYGCGHCYAFDPYLTAWSDKLPDDVNLVRLPAMFGGAWNIHGQLFLTLESMGVESKIHQDIFNAVQSGQRLTDPEDMADFVAARGVDRDKFLSTFQSFAITGQMEKAKKLAKAYKVSGVPTMLVNGKYRFDIGSAGGPEETLKLADYLIDKERNATANVAK